MEVELSSRVDGVLENVLLQRGDAVKANQIVAELESTGERAALEYARARAQMTSEISEHAANFQFGTRNESRIKELHAKKMASASEIDRVRTESTIARYKLDRAKENKRLAELELARAEVSLDRRKIRSPIDGVVMERYLNPGESVEDKPVMKLAQIDPLRVEVVVPIAEYRRIRPGDQALVYPEAAFGGEYASTVTTVDAVFDAASGTFRVQLVLPNSDNRLTGGLKCQVEFAGRGPHASTARHSSLPQPADAMASRAPAR